MRCQELQDSSWGVHIQLSTYKHPLGLGLQLSAHVSCESRTSPSEVVPARTLLLEETLQATYRGSRVAALSLF